MFVRDAAVSRIFLGPVAYFQTQTLIEVAGQLPIMNAVVASPSSAVQTPPSVEYLGGSGTSSIAAKSKIPRPPNAFIIYRKEHHAATLAKNPGVHNNTICKCHKIHYADKWTNVSQRSSLARCGPMRALQLGQIIRLRLRS
jgi:hypothetical protein